MTNTMKDSLYDLLRIVTLTLGWIHSPLLLFSALLIVFDLLNPFAFVTKLEIRNASAERLWVTPLGQFSSLLNEPPIGLHLVVSEWAPWVALRQKNFELASHGSVTFWFNDDDVHPAEIAVENGKGDRRMLKLGTGTRRYSLEIASFQELPRLDARAAAGLDQLDTYSTNVLLYFAGLVPLSFFWLSGYLRRRMDRASGRTASATL